MRAQMSAELVIIASVAIGMLFAMFIINGSLQKSWALQQAGMEASGAADQAAAAIGAAASGGNGARIMFINSVPRSVVGMSVFGSRSVRAHHSLGGYSSSPLTTGAANFTEIPTNQRISFVNNNGTINIEVD